MVSDSKHYVHGSESYIMNKFKRQNELLFKNYVNSFIICEAV